MNKTIKLRVKKAIDNPNEQKVIKLKGSIIAQGYTEIIHIADENEDFYLNSFQTLEAEKTEAEKFITDFIASNALEDTISIIG